MQQQVFRDQLQPGPDFQRACALRRQRRLRRSPTLARICRQALLRHAVLLLCATGGRRRRHGLARCDAARKSRRRGRSGLVLGGRSCGGGRPRACVVCVRSTSSGASSWRGRRCTGLERSCRQRRRGYTDRDERYATRAGWYARRACRLLRAR